MKILFLRVHVEYRLSGIWKVIVRPSYNNMWRETVYFKCGNTNLSMNGSIGLFFKTQLGQIKTFDRKGTGQMGWKLPEFIQPLKSLNKKIRLLLLFLCIL